MKIKSFMFTVKVTHNFMPYLVTQPAMIFMTFSCNNFGVRLTLSPQEFESIVLEDEYHLQVKTKGPHELRSVVVSGAVGISVKDHADALDAFFSSCVRPVFQIEINTGATPPHIVQGTVEDVDLQLVNGRHLIREFNHQELEVVPQEDIDFRDCELRTITVPEVIALKCNVALTDAEKHILGQFHKEMIETIGDMSQDIDTPSNRICKNALDIIERISKK